MQRLKTTILIVFIYVLSFSAELTVQVNNGRIPLEDASLSILENNANLLTDEKGICIFKNIPTGKYTIYAMLAGYEKYSNTIEINGMDLNIEICLKPSVYSLGEINIESKRNSGRVDTENTVNKEEIEANSQGIINDSFKTLQLMPGVSSGGSAMDSSMFIQGGNSTEWIAYMDGIYIMNPTRWSGGIYTISMFNPSFVDSINLYTAAYPSMFGQGLSGVIVVDTINGSKERWKGFIDISPIESEVLLEGPITSNLTISFDMRRTYYDLYYPLFLPTNQRSLVQEWPYLWDGISKFCWDITHYDNLSIVAYFSLEGEKWDLGNGNDNPQVLSGFKGSYQYQILNFIGSLKYSHRFDSGDFFDIVAGDSSENGSNTYSQEPYLFGNVNFNNTWYQLSSDYYLNSIEGHKIQIGGIIIYDNPGFYCETNQYNNYFYNNQQGWFLSNYQNFNYSYGPSQSSYYGVYLMDNWEIFPSIILELGGREEYFSLNKESAFDPQGGIKLECTKELDLYLRGGFYHDFPQFNYLISNIGNPNLQSEKVYHAITGVDYSDNDYMLRIEGFYKYYYDLDETDSLLNYNNDGLRNVYGGDIYLQKKPKKGDWLSGWISYTYVYGLEEITNRSPDNPNIPYSQQLDQWFVPDYLRSHTISILVEMTYYKNPDQSLFFDFLNEWKFTVQLTAMSGLPYTPATNSTQYEIYYGAYDSTYTPWYCRLDLKLTIPLGGGLLKGFFGPYAQMYFYVEVLNALNYNNVISYYYTINNGQLTQAELQDFSIMPLGGFRIEF